VQLAAAADAHAEFVGRMLRSANPWVVRDGDDATGAGDAEAGRSMVRALDLAARELEASGGDSPLSEAAVRLGLAQSYHGVGRLDDAERHTEHALELFSEELGDAHEYTVRALVLASAIQDDRGRYRDARALLDRAAAAAEEAPVVETRTRVAVYNSLCRTSIRTESLEEAESFARRAVALAAEGGVPSNTRNGAQLGLADALAHQRRFEEAEPLYLEILARRQEELGLRHPSTLVVQHNLAGLLIRSGRASEAVPHLEHVLASRKEVLGEAHSMTLMAMNDLVYAYLGLGMLEEGRKLAEESLAAHVATLGNRHTLSSTARNTLARICLMQRKFDRCAELLEESIAIETASQGESSPQVLTLKNNLGVVYREMGRFEESATILAEAYERRRQRDGALHPQARSIRYQLAEVHLALRQDAAARTIIDELLAAEAQARDFAWLAGMLRGADALCLGREGRADDAEARFREAVGMLESSFGRGDRRTRKVIRHAVEFCREHGRADDEARWQAMLQ
ncbi:MAG: tetratricopeptide repeat protein, partial [Planctomycetota bacterium]